LNVVNEAVKPHHIALEQTAVVRQDNPALACRGRGKLCVLTIAFVRSVETDQAQYRASRPRCTSAKNGGSRSGSGRTRETAALGTPVLSRFVL
jgi:hypothetical protein